jgi:hypothetical protein
MSGTSISHSNIILFMFFPFFSVLTYEFQRLSGLQYNKLLSSHERNGAHKQHIHSRCPIFIETQALEWKSLHLFNYVVALGASQNRKL